MDNNLHPKNAKPGWYIVEIPDDDGYMRFMHVKKKHNWLLIFAQVILIIVMLLMMHYA